MSLLTVLLLGGIIAFSSLNLRTLQSEFNNYQLNRDNHQAMIEIKAAAFSISRADPRQRTGDEQVAERIEHHADTGRDRDQPEEGE